MWVSSTPWTGVKAGEFAAATTLQQATVICLAWIIVSLRTRFYQPRRTGTLLGELKILIEA